MMRNYLLTVCLSLWSCAWLSAQPFSISVLGKGQGLSSSYVTDMTTDKQGRIWIATEEGLNRLQGRSLQTFLKDGHAASSIAGNALNCLLDDPRDHILWIGTQHDGLCAYDYERGTFTTFVHNDDDSCSLATDDITSLSPASDGRLWVCTFWRGVERMDQSAGTFEHWNPETVEGLTASRNLCAVEDRDGHLLIGHAEDGLSVVDLRTRKARRFLPDPADRTSLAGNAVHSMLCDSRGRLWVGTNHGLCRYDPATSSFVSYDDGGRLDNRIFSIREMSDGRLWLATEWQGIVIMTPSAADGVGTYSYIQGDGGPGELSGNSFRCLMEDGYGNIWAGVYGGGVNFLTRHQPLFQQLRKEAHAPTAGLTNKVAMSVCRDRQGRLWVGTDGDGVNIFSADGQRIGHRLAGTSVQTIAQDREGRLWIGCYEDGIYLTDDGSRIQHLLQQEDVRSLRECSDGRLMWVCTSTGLYAIDKNSLQTHAHVETRSPLTRCVTVDRQGRRWVGTYGGGIEVYSADMKRTALIDTSTEFPSNIINQLLTDGDGQVWAATADGLVCAFSPDSFRVYGWESGLNNLHIRALCDDGHGNLWASTCKGISCLQHGQQTFQNFTYHDHVPDGDFCPASVARDDSTLYFGSTNGLCSFSPGQVLRQRPAPEVYMAAAWVLTAHGDSLVQMPSQAKLRLRYNENNLRLLLGTRNYALTGATQYAYLIEGLTDYWMTTTDENLMLHNLPAGSYRLLVHSRLTNQAWGEPQLLLAFTIAPPWWRAWWAYALYAMALLLLVYAVYSAIRSRRHIRNLQEQWERLSQSMGRQAEEQERKKTAMQASLGELDQQFLSTINRLIEDRISSDQIDVAYLANGACVSQSTLYRKMKSLTGISSNEYVRKYKIHYAERLLAEGRYTVSEVAFMVGMQTPSYFRKCFKDEFGDTLGNYLKQLKGKTKADNATED
ncbi:MAG: helix-turn-helix domain-containing protein [Prevotella sp.]|nr:helix-turn-helix domain-containing protein [Prevotella sp.]